MAARTKGAPSVVLPSSSKRTRGLAASRRRKYSTVCAHEASLRSSPGRKPSTSSGAGTAAGGRAGWRACGAESWSACGATRMSSGRSSSAREKRFLGIVRSGVLFRAGRAKKIFGSGEFSTTRGGRRARLLTAGCAPLDIVRARRRAELPARATRALPPRDSDLRSILMSNPWCPVCGHVNMVGAEVCAMCDSRLGAGGEEGRDYARGAGEGGYGGYGEETRAGALPTFIPSPRFQGVGDVLGPTLEVYRKHFLLVGLLVLATTLPQALLQYAAAAAFSTASFGPEDDGISAASGGLALAAGSAVSVLSVLLMRLGGSALSGALAYAVVGLQRTGAARAGGCLRWGLRKMLRVFSVSVVSALIMYAIPGFLILMLSVALGPLALILGFLVMLLPWVVLTLMFSLAVPAAAVEGRGIIESMARSVELTKGFRGLIFLTYFLWWIAIIVLNLVIT